MGTRRAQNNQPLSQERYASVLRTGETLLGNLVAKKCDAVKSAKHRRLILFLQDLSLRVGCRTHPTANLFPAWSIGAGVLGECSPFERVAEELRCLFPGVINPALQKRTPELLTAFCLDPKFCASGIGELLDCLERYRQRLCEPATQPGIAQTATTTIVWETLDYALSQGGMVLVEGTYRVGKSFSAQAWALRHLGEARYVQLSSSRDDTSFYRDIARALGTACSAQRKGSEIRMRIEAMLRTQSLLLVLDEAQYIWPQSLRPQTPPERVNWLISALLNNGASVALIGSRDFTRMMRNVERKCPAWGSEQFHGRLRLQKHLPDALSEADLENVARTIMPEASPTVVLLLVAHALKSKGRIAAIESAVTRARFFAGRNGRPVATFSDVECALIESGSASQSFREPVAKTPPGIRDRRSIISDSGHPRRRLGSRPSAIAAI